jgi:hypothetical protein
VIAALAAIRRRLRVTWLRVRIWFLLSERAQHQFFELELCHSNPDLAFHHQVQARKRADQAACLQRKVDAIRAERQFLGARGAR